MSPSLTLSSSPYLQKYHTTIDQTTLSYRLYSGNTTLPIIVFVHGLFGSATLFHPIASILSKKGIPSLALDLRWFGESEHKNTSLDTFSSDLISILLAEKLLIEQNQVYRCTRPIILTGYSMGTLVTSITKRKLDSSADTNTNTGALTSIESLSELDLEQLSHTITEEKGEGEKEKEEKKEKCVSQEAPIITEQNHIASPWNSQITLCHISPILDIKKRLLFRHLSFLGEGDIDLKFLHHPFAFFQLIWEILDARRYVDLAGYIISWRWDFCFYRESSSITSFPVSIQVFEHQDHYLLYRVPKALADYLFSIVNTRENKEEQNRKEKVVF